MRKFISILIVAVMLLTPCVYVANASELLWDFASLSDVNIDDGIEISEDPENSTNKVLKFSGGKLKWAEFAVAPDFNTPFNIEGKYFRECEEEKNLYWDLRIFLMTDSEPVMVSAFGKNIYMGNKWENISVYDYEKNSWNKFRIRFTEENGNLYAELFLDGNFYEKADLGQIDNVSAIKIGAQTGLNNGLVYIDDILYVNETAQMTELLNKIENNEEISEEDCKEWLSYFSENVSQQTSLYYYMKIYEYAQNKGYVHSGILENAFPKNSDEIYAGDGLKMTYSYSSFLADDFNVTLTLGETKVDEVKTSVELGVISISAPLVPDKEYKLEITGLKDTLGNDIAFEPVVFKTSFIPIVDVVENGRYEYGKTVSWTNGAGMSTKVVLKSDNGETEIISGDVIENGGNVSLYIESEKDGVKKEHTISFYVIPNTPPVASEVKITGKLLSGEELIGTYKYYDEEGDVQSGTTFGWYTSDTKDGEYKLYKSGDKIKIDNNLYNKYLKYGVIPKSNHAPKEGKLTLSEATLMPFAPVAKNVYTGGSTYEGGTIAGYYDYYDENKDQESLGSILEWVTRDGTVVGTGATLLLTSLHAGREIAFRVTPKNSAVPNEGTPVLSDFVVISYASTAPSYSGGSSGGGGMIVGSNSGTAVKPSAPTTPATPTTPSTPVLEDGVFKDTSSHWAKETIKELKLKGIVNGVSETEFMPDEAVTRAQFIAMIMRATSNDFAKYAGAFSDVKEADWYADYVQTALNDGIISIDKNFRPDDNITREEAAKILSAFVDKGEIEVSYSDADKISGWAEMYVAHASSTGLFKGDENGNFNPKNSLTRAESATVISRLLALMGGEIDE